MKQVNIYLYAPGAGDDAVDKSETFYGSIFKKIDGY